MRRTIQPCYRDRAAELVNGNSDEILRTDDLALVAKALSHPARLEIIAELASGRPVIAGSIATESGLARSTVSEHLRLLSAAGVLHRCQEGPAVRYRLEHRRVRAFLEGIDRLSVNGPVESGRDLRP